MKLNCLIVDDEPVARKGLEEYVKEVDFLQLIAKCDSATKALPFMEEGLVDLIFMDIQMPRLTGIEFLKGLTNPPMIIFTTAHSEYALEGYSLDVIDYLLKPISFNRFLRASEKARDYYAITHHLTERKEIPNYFFVKCDGKYEKIGHSDVLYLEAMQNYVIIHIENRKLITYNTLTGLEEQLPKDLFLKIHKSYVVAIQKIKAIEGNEVIINEERIPISRNLKEEAMKRILKNDVLKRG
jgi:DNA-binding LytR/AlgR family response regulator